MNAPQVVDKFLEGSSPESYLVAEDVARLIQWFQSTWHQGAAAKAEQLNYRYGLSELEPIIYPKLESPSFNVETLPLGDKNE